MKKVKMKKVLLSLLAVAVIFGMSESALARLGKGAGSQNTVDVNNNGIADGQEDFDSDGVINRDDEDYEKQYANMKDDDSDGVANKEDSDRIVSQDGSGQQNNFGKNAQEEDANGSGIQNQESQEQNANRINNRYNNPELGEQVKNMAQEQVRNQELIKNDLQKLQNRGGIIKFFLGLSHGKIKSAEEKLNQCDKRILELEELSEQVVGESDKALLDEQIEGMKEVGTQLKQQLKNSDSGFSLFGWMFKLFN